MLTNLDIQTLERYTDFVWHVKDAKMGKKYFVKMVYQCEIDTTINASEIEFPEDSDLQIVTVVGNQSVLPPDILNRINEEKQATKGPYSYSDLGFSEIPPELMVTEDIGFEFTNPNGAYIVIGALDAKWKNDGLKRFFNEQGFPLCLRDQPLTQEEINRLRRDLKIINDAGIKHNDISSNLFVERTEDGTIRFCLIDFDPDFAESADPDVDTQHLDLWIERRRDNKPALMELAK